MGQTKESCTNGIDFYIFMCIGVKFSECGEFYAWFLFFVFWWQFIRISQKIVEKPRAMFRHFALWLKKCVYLFVVLFCFVCVCMCINALLVCTRYVFIISMRHTMFAIYLFGFGKQIFILSLLVCTPACSIPIHLSLYLTKRILDTSVYVRARARKMNHKGKWSGEKWMQWNENETREREQKKCFECKWNNEHGMFNCRRIGTIFDVTVLQQTHIKLSK